MEVKKYKLIKKFAFTALTIGLISTSIGKKYNNVNLTYADSEFFNELDNIKNSSIVFNNKELYDYIINDNNDLRNIKNLYIRKRFVNNDFGDLKYLTNLEKLTIQNNDINLADLEYNQNLKYLDIDSSKVFNTYRLPNTINELYLNDTTVEDRYIVVPYNIKTLYLKGINAINLYFKEPSNLENIILDNCIYFDALNLSECHNIKILAIKKCINVYNACELLNLKIDRVVLDDYAPIWMNLYTANNLNFVTENDIDILTEIRKLDSIANTLDDIDDDRRINNVINYILNKYSYNKSVANNSDARQNLINYYVTNPINSSFLENEVIDVNYATLFVALSKRLNIDVRANYNDKYMWNSINGNIVDLASWDNDNFYIDDYNSIAFEPVCVKDYNVGYVKRDENIEYYFNENEFKKYLLPYLMILIGSSLLSVGLEEKDHCKKKTLNKNKK